MSGPALEPSRDGSSAVSNVPQFPHVDASAAPVTFPPASPDQQATAEAIRTGQQSPAGPSVTLGEAPSQAPSPQVAGADDASAPQEPERPVKGWSIAGHIAFTALILVPGYALASPFLLFYSIGWLIGGLHEKATDPTGKATLMGGELARELFMPFLVQAKAISDNLQGYGLGEREALEEAQRKTAKRATELPKTEAPFQTADIKDPAKAKKWIAEPSNAAKTDPADGKYMLAKLLQHWKEQQTDEAKAIVNQIVKRLSADSMPLVTLALIVKDLTSIDPKGQTKDQLLAALNNFVSPQPAGLSPPPPQTNQPTT